MTSTEAMKYLIKHPRAKLQWYETDRKVYLSANEPGYGVLPESNLIQPYEHFLRWLKEGWVTIVNTSRGGLSGTIHQLRYRDVPQEKLVTMPERALDANQPGYVQGLRRDLWEQADEAQKDADFKRGMARAQENNEIRKTHPYPFSHDFIRPYEPGLTDLDNLG